MRELCTTSHKRIKPQFCAGLQFVLTSTCSMKNRHAVVTRWPYAMYHRELMSYAALWLLCQTNLPSCVARQPLCQTNLPSCVARWPLSQTISNLLPSEEQMRPALPREISGLTSHDRINTMGGVYTPVHALMNNKWRCTVFNKGNLSKASINVVVSKSTENIGCSFVNSETKSNNIRGVFLHTSSCYFSISKRKYGPWQCKW